jgi:hypothetical protein
MNITGSDIKYDGSSKVTAVILIVVFIIFMTVMCFHSITRTERHPNSC